jgi:putative ABC transport system substrate-binding protein
MNNRRKLLIALGAGALAAPFSAFAQQQGKVWRIGFLGVGNAQAYAYPIDALRAGLRDFGYTEGNNFVLESRWAEGDYDRLPQLATELIRSKVDVLVTHATPGTRAARQVSSTMPIVMTDIAADPVALGIVENLARPGGNITGSTIFGVELTAKRLELLKDAVPRIKRIASLVNPSNLGTTAIVKEANMAAKAMKVEMLQFESRQPTAFDTAFLAMVRSRAEAILIQDEPLFTSDKGMLANLAVNHRLPSAGYSEFAEAGGMIGYGVNFRELYRRAAYFVDKIV